MLPFQPSPPFQVHPLVYVFTKLAAPQSCYRKAATRLSRSLIMPHAVSFCHSDPHPNIASVSKQELYFVNKITKFAVQRSLQGRNEDNKKARPHHLSNLKVLNLQHLLRVTPRPSYFKDSLNWPNTNV